MAMCHFVQSQVSKIDINGFFVQSQNGNVPFCAITKWHSDILCNHKNSKFIFFDEPENN